MPRGLPGLPLAKPLESAHASSGTLRYFFILSLPLSDHLTRLDLEHDRHRLAAQHLEGTVLPVFTFLLTEPQPNVIALSSAPQLSCGASQ